VNSEALNMLWNATLETLLMVGSATVLAVLGGLPLGILLAATAPGASWNAPGSTGCWGR
jgi:ABC-type methionine transport system permease subunit